MKATVQKKDLARMLRRCEAVADKKGTSPILAGVLLDARGGDGLLHLAATNLEQSLRTSVLADLEEPGSVVVGARELYDRVSVMPDGDITLAVKGSSLVLQGGKRRFTLPTMAAADFPNLPAAPDELEPFALPIPTLLSLIGATQHSISADISRPHLNSALLESGNDAVRMVSTDGHRLSRCDLPCVGSPKLRLLIPLRAVGEIRKLCDDAQNDAQNEVKIQATADSAFFRLPGMEYSFKLVADSSFPPYEQVIPSSHSRAAIVERDPFIETLRAIEISANKKTGGVRFRFGHGSLKVEGESPESGEGADELQIESDSSPLTIAACARYLIDAASAISSPKITIECCDELDPIVIKPTEENPTSMFSGVIMPMRL